MIDKNYFFENFSKGRLIWIKGSKGLRKISLAYQLLRLGSVKDAEVLHLSAECLNRKFEGSIRAELLAPIRVLLIHGFDALSAENWNQFISSVSEFKTLHFLHEVRVILVGTHDLSLKRQVELLHLKPVVLEVDGESRTLDFDRYLHNLIEQASLRANKSVLRLTERAAAFFESVSDEMDDEELVDLLCWGILCSKNSTLRLSDFFSSKSLNFEVLNEGETQ